VSARGINTAAQMLEPDVYISSPSILLRVKVSQSMSEQHL